MRFRDLINLALAALWQQKVRTMLTTLGVLSGSFVLLASLSVRIGVDERIVEESARFRQLREIRVFPGARSRSTEVQEKVVIRGNMSEARRKRLRADVKLHRQRFSPMAYPKPITRERLREISQIPHVTAVRPRLDIHGRAVFGKQAEYVQVMASTIDLPMMHERLVAGQYLSADDATEVIVSEYLLYRLGVIDEADVDKAIGRTLRLEYQGRRPNPGWLAVLLSGGRVNEFTARDEEFMSRILKQITESVRTLDLTPADRARLEQMLKPSRKKPKQTKPRLTKPLVREFRIVGVVRSPTEEETNRRIGWQLLRSDVLLPVDTMAEFYFQAPELKRRGFETAVVEVDDIQHVKTVTEAIKATGLEAHSSLRAVEHQQAIYGLIFSAMTVVACIALFVAALGITNTMIMSVLERVRQIGVMKAVGARNSQIQAIFLIEGAMIGLIGGTLGTVLAYVASGPADGWVNDFVQRDLSIALTGSIFAFPWPLLVGVPLFSMLVTTFSAFFPARRAAAVDPVTALRHE